METSLIFVVWSNPLLSSANYWGPPSVAVGFSIRLNASVCTKDQVMCWG